MSMQVHRSNVPERLVDRLAQLVRVPVGGALVPECIVVQGKGMERWLAMQLAGRLGIWANPDFPFPQNLLERAFGSLLGPAEGGVPWTSEHLVWAVAAELAALPAEPAFAPLAAYLDGAGEERARRAVQLAERIAWLFGRYLTLRPDWVAAWERGEEAPRASTLSETALWQGALWRRLLGRLGPHHFLARARAFLAAAAEGTGPLPDFPRRVSFFGVSSLPPLFLELLGALGQRLELHLFLLCPSKEYWAEIRSRREQWRAWAGGSADAPGPELPLVEGHPLLASLGLLGREFQGLFEGLCAYDEEDEDLFAEPRGGGADGAADSDRSVGAPGLLAGLQADILHLRRPTPARDDGSVGIHSCHSPLRELEVLRDQLLALFEADPTLEPRDVVVMTPAVETYAPFIEAVFAGDPADGGLIPCRVADRSARAAESVLDALGRLLEVLPGRCTLGEVLELLALAPVRERFEISDEELDTLGGWLAEAGVRWGADAAHRVACGQPDTGLNTWRFGLDRLLLGYAMPGLGRELFAGVLPTDAVSGGAAALLGRLCAFAEAFFALRESLLAPRPLGAWRGALGEALGRMVAENDDNAPQHQLIRRALEGLATKAEAAGFVDPIDLATVWTQLEARCQEALPAHGFLSGGVTFCDLVPMRTIPFRVLCLVGLADDAFPRHDRPLSFDLAAARRRPGDRTRRDDDRYSLLEALLAARERLIITYVGQGIRDNAELPPSVVLADLLDAFGEALAPGDPGARGALVIRHPLQAASPRYFDRSDPRLFSFASSLCTTAQGGAPVRPEPPPLVSRPLAPVAAAVGAGERPLDLEQLVRFFALPARAFVRGRLGIQLGDGLDTPENREPVELEGLAWHRAGQALLGRVLGGEPLMAALPALVASGVLPHGAPGRLAFEGLGPAVQAVAEAVAPWLEGGPRDPVSVDLVLSGTRLSGLVPVWAAGQVLHGFRRLRADRQLELWIRHLALGAAGAPTLSHGVGLADKGPGAAEVTFKPAAAPKERLAELVELYWLGQRFPLPFFPKAALAYATVAGADPAKALAAARRLFEAGHFNAFGEGADPFVRLAFGEGDPLDPRFGPGIEGAEELAAGDPPALDFASLALRIFAPLLQDRS